ncbi:MAG: hypothetical protein HDR16_11335 [Lachnospiraceae bacterium]|nr:hypothetical protein [Lachnospiraceae bacterium]
MDEGHQRELSPCQRKSVVIRVTLLLLCVFILYGEYTMQKAKRDKLVENEQNITMIAETNEKKNSVITNEYQTRLQNEYNTYEIKDGKLYGSGYIMVLSEEGTLYTMGDNLNGQLGNGTARPVRNEWYGKEGTVYSSEPVHVMNDIAFIAADAYTAAAISNKGDLWVWGDNSFGEIGNRRRGNGLPSVSTDVVSEPYLVLKQIKEVRFDDFTVYAVDFQNQEYSWGKNATAFPKPVADNVKIF